MRHAEQLTHGTRTAYAELLTQLLQGPLSATGVSWFTRPVKGRDYWYMQFTVGGVRRSTYIGPDNETVRTEIQRARELAARSDAERTTRERLVAQAAAGGMASVGAAEGRVYEVMAQAGVFDAGGALVGSHAFFALGNLLGVRWLTDIAQRTEDLDLARDPQFEVALDPGHEINLIDVLRQADKAFFPVPALDPKSPTTAFKLRGKPFSVSLLAPARGREEFEVVTIPSLNAAAESLRFLDYLLEDVQPAAVLTASGVLVQVPTPARFALHKLVASQCRKVAVETKAAKDIAQAAAILELLQETRPGDVDIALDAAQAMGRKFITQLRAGARQLPEPLSGWLLSRM